MASLNVWSATGRCTKDPDLRHVGSDGTAVLKFSVAVDLLKKKEGKFETEPMFVQVELWGRRAETLVDFFSKGSPIAFCGEIRMETWRGRDGEERTALVCRASAVEPMESKAQREERETRTRTGSAARTGAGDGWDPDAGSGGNAGNDDDLPF